jgi:hypothetical protein
VGPPANWDDRRKKVERRLPLAEVTEMSAEDFAMYFGALPSAPKAINLPLELATDVFDPARSRY